MPEDIWPAGSRPEETATETGPDPADTPAGAEEVLEDAKGQAAEQLAEEADRLASTTRDLTDDEKRGHTRREIDLATKGAEPTFMPIPYERRSQGPEAQHLRRKFRAMLGDAGTALRASTHLIDSLVEIVLTEGEYCLAEPVPPRPTATSGGRPEGVMTTPGARGG